MSDLPVVDVHKLVSQEKVSNAIVTSRALMRVQISGSCVLTISYVLAHARSFHRLSLVRHVFFGNFCFVSGSTELKNIESGVKIEALYSE